ncbi:MAG TPA: hypothetical protein VI385_12540 [Flavisolibacter sp.]|jgi:hypothetical protein
MRIQKLFILAFVFVFLFTLVSIDSQAQCSICTRTAQQLGEKPARGLNAGILYLAFTPLALMGVIGYKFYKKYNEKN